MLIKFFIYSICIRRLAGIQFSVRYFTLTYDSNAVEEPWSLDDSRSSETSATVNQTHMFPYLVPMACNRDFKVETDIAVESNVRVSVLASKAVGNTDVFVCFFILSM